jgi:hypothetical protein
MGLDKHADSFVYAALDLRGDMTRQLDVFFNPRSSCAEGFFQGAVGALALFCLARLLVELAQMVKLVANLVRCRTATKLLKRYPQSEIRPSCLSTLMRRVGRRCISVRA